MPGVQSRRPGADHTARGRLHGRADAVLAHDSALPPARFAGPRAAGEGHGPHALRFGDVASKRIESPGLAGDVGTGSVAHRSLRS